MKDYPDCAVTCLPFYQVSSQLYRDVMVGTVMKGWKQVKLALQGF